MPSTLDRGGQVDVLEHAEAALLLVNGLIERKPLPSTMTISPGSTSRTSARR
jgi:hypothetical protein